MDVVTTSISGLNAVITWTEPTTNGESILEY